MVLLLVALVLGAAAQASTGIGFALVVAPVAVLALDAGEVVGTVVRLSLLVDLFVVAQAPRSVDLRLVRTYLVAAALAVPVAALALRAVSDRDLLLGAAVLTLLGAAALVRGPRRPLATPAVAVQALAGFASGFLGMTTGMSGPPVAIETGRRRLPLATARPSLAAFFAVVDGTAVVLNPDAVGLGTTVVLVAAVVVGIVLGRRLAGLVREPVLRRAIALIVLASAVAAIVRLVA